MRAIIDRGDGDDGRLIARVGSAAAAAPNTHELMRTRPAIWEAIGQDLAGRRWPSASREVREKGLPESDRSSLEFGFKNEDESLEGRRVARSGRSIQETSEEWKLPRIEFK